MNDIQTLRDIVRHTLDTYADLTAYSVINADGWTYRQVGYAVAGIQRRLAGDGITSGDRVALLSENQPGWPAAYLSITSGGAVAVPILPDFSPPEVVEIIEHSGASLLIASRKQLQRLEGAPDTSVPVPVLVLEDLAEGAVSPPRILRSSSTPPARPGTPRV